MTLSEKISKLERASRDIERGARLWCEGNNSGNSQILTIKEKESQKSYEKAERLIKSVFADIVIDYPGLYPAFKIDGFNFYSVESLINHLKQG